MVWAALVAAILLVSMISGPRRAKPRPAPVERSVERTEPRLAAEPSRHETHSIPAAPPLPPIRAVGSPTHMLGGDGSYSFAIVGESRQQGALEDIAASRSKDSDEPPLVARLVPEPSNPYDANAVRVEIDGRLVGYLSRAHAVEYDAALSALGAGGRVFACRAMLKGGWDGGPGDRGYFGVDLDLDWPPRIES